MLHGHFETRERASELVNQTRLKWMPRTAKQNTIEYKQKQFDYRATRGK